MSMLQTWLPEFHNSVLGGRECATFHNVLRHKQIVNRDLATHHVCVVKLWRVQLMVSKYVKEGVFEVTEPVVRVRFLWVRGR